MSVKHGSVASDDARATSHIDADVLLLTSTDSARLEHLAVGESADIRERLQQKLSQANIVGNQDVPSNIATMGSVLRYRIGDGPWQRRILSFPDEAPPPSGQYLNVVTVIGLALLGRREGESFETNLPDGRCVTIELDEVSFQPEAAARKKTDPSGDGPDAA